MGDGTYGGASVVERSLDHLDLVSVVAVARHGARVTVGDEARERILASRRHVEGMIEEVRAVYGVTTGFGALATKHIPTPERREIQHSVLRSHAAGMGPLVEPEVVRAMMVVRAKTLAMGFSGVSVELVEALVALLNSGLVLINGTDGMLGMLILALEDLGLLLRTADVTAAMSVEALLGTDRVFREELHAVRPHPGQLSSTRNIYRLLNGSPIVASHRDSAHLVQDAYSLRCVPQVYGAVRDTMGFAAGVAERELRSTTDNPIVLPDGRVESTGNFHGEPLAFALDFLAIAASEVGAITERRIDRMLDSSRSEGLPPFLSSRAGTNSGFMISHYTAASLVEENRRLAAPASVGSLPASAMQEDHNSMGWSAARKLRTVLENLRLILAVEALCAAQALESPPPLNPGPATSSVLKRIRRDIAFMKKDRFLAPDLRKAEELVRTGELARSAGEAIGALE